jgi:preprotein translocase subunit SecE
MAAKAFFKTKKYNYIMKLVEKTKSFLKEVYVELKRVSWLSRKDVLRYTMIVLAVSLAVASFLGGLDYIFSEIIKKFVF